MTRSLLLHLVGLLHRLTLWSGALKPKLVLHRWHFGMLELQPIYFLVPAVGSRLAVPSNLAIATFFGKSDYQVHNMYKPKKHRCCLLPMVYLLTSTYSITPTSEYKQEKMSLVLLCTREHGNA